MVNIRERCIFNYCLGPACMARVVLLTAVGRCVFSFRILFFLIKRRIVYVRVSRNNKQTLSGEIQIEDYQQALVVYYIILLEETSRPPPCSVPLAHSPLVFGAVNSVRHIPSRSVVLFFGSCI